MPEVWPMVILYINPQLYYSHVKFFCRIFWCSIDIQFIPFRLYNRPLAPTNSKTMKDIWKHQTSLSISWFSNTWVHFKNALPADFVVVVVQFNDSKFSRNVFYIRTCYLGNLICVSIFASRMKYRIRALMWQLFCAEICFRWLLGLHGK